MVDFLKKVIIICAIYTRFSSLLQDQMSTERQTEKCKDYAASHGWEVVEQYIFSDEAISGTSIHPRDALMELLKIVKSGEASFSYILVESMSRLSRDVPDAVEILRTMNYYNVGVIYINEGVISTQASAEMSVGMITLINAGQIQKISEGTHDGQAKAFKNGQSVGGRYYGYRSEPVYDGDNKDLYGHRIIKYYTSKVEESEAVTIKRIWSLYGEKGLSPTAIANLLNSDLNKTGSPRPPLKATKWTAEGIYRILGNQRYLGICIWNKTTSKKHPETKKKIKIRNPRSKWIIIEHPELRIIPPDLADKVALLRNEISEISSGIRQKAIHAYSEHLITRSAKCGQCGGTFGIASGGNYSKCACITHIKSKGKSCSNGLKVDEQLLTESIIACCIDYLTDESAMSIFFNDFITETNKWIGDISRDNSESTLKAELQDIDQRLERVLDFVEQGGNAETARRRLKKLEGQRKEVLTILSLASRQDEIDVAKYIKYEHLKYYLINLVRTLHNPKTTVDTFKTICKEISISSIGDAGAQATIIINADNTARYLLGHLPRNISHTQSFLRSRATSFRSRIFTVRIVTTLQALDLGISAESDMIIIV